MKLQGKGSGFFVSPITTRVNESSLCWHLRWHLFYRNSPIFGPINFFPGHTCILYAFYFRINCITNSSSDHLVIVYDTWHCLECIHLLSTLESLLVSRCPIKFWAHFVGWACERPRPVLNAVSDWKAKGAHKFSSQPSLFRVTEDISIWFGLRGWPRRISAENNRALIFHPTCIV